MTGIAAFVQVAESGAFVQAARALDLSPSAASKAVSRLEDHLGVKLLHRTTRSVGLTPEGERYQERARYLLEELEILGQEVSDRTAAPVGRLSVNAPSALARTWLINHLNRFQTDWPQVDLELSLDDRSVDLAAGGVDVVIRSGPIADRANLVARKLYDETLHVCAAPSYWVEHERPNHPADLKDHRCLNFRSAQTGRHFPWQFRFDGRDQTIAVGGGATIDDGEAVFRACVVGLGVAQLPGYMARAAIRTGSLVEVMAGFRPVPTPISALYLDRRMLSPRIRVFIDFLVAAVQASDLSASPDSS